MKLSINKRAPLGLKEQVKQQIRAMVQTGGLKEGDALPSARDLALLLGVNRNTTWAAYRDLVQEGLLLSRRGSGTYVGQVAADPELELLTPLFEEMLAKAAGLGIDPVRTAGLFADHVAALSREAAQKRVLVVECNQWGLDALAATLAERFGVRAQKMFIQDLEVEGEEHLQSLGPIDLVVCGFNHASEFRRAAPGCKARLVPVMLAPDVKLVRILHALPPGTRAGFTCANARSTENLYKHQVFASGASLSRWLVGTDDKKELKRMMDACDIIFASEPVYEAAKKTVPAGKRLVKVEIALDEAALAVIGSALGAGARFN